MRKYKLFLFTVLISYNVFTQEPKIALGIKLTPSIVDTYGDGAGFGDPRISYSAGLNMDYLLTERVSLKTGLFQTRKGSRVEFQELDQYGNITGQTVRIRDNFDYLILSTQASLSNAKNTVFIAAGPYLGYLIKQSYKQDPETVIVGTDNYNAFDFGMTFSIGIRKTIIEKIDFEIGLEENLGLLNIGKTQLGKIRTNSLGIFIGLNYKI